MLRGRQSPSPRPSIPAPQTHKQLVSIAWPWPICSAQVTEAVKVGNLQLFEQAMVQHYDLFVKVRLQAAALAAFFCCAGAGIAVVRVCCCCCCCSSRADDLGWSQSGVYLVVEKLRTIILRNFLKKLHLVSPPPQVRSTHPSRSLLPVDSKLVDSKQRTQ